MMRLIAVLIAFPALAQEAEIQRSVIQRDQQSAEFAARVRGEDTALMQRLHAQQLSEVMSVPLQTELRPYQRQKMADELLRSLKKPLALPGGPKHGVDPVPVQGPGY